MQNKEAKIPIAVGAISTIEPDIPTVTPTIKPKNKIVPAVKNKTVDPFAIIFSQKDAPAPKATSKPSQNNQPVNTQAPPQPVADNRCIIAIDGVRYDVSVFRNQHSGGDIFSCGTDMSAIFHGQHPNSFLQRMAQYKI
ncbi:cytochrome b5 domain-containing protein [Candidatus Shapirobacteria bacterium]|nr:cytochrome b5 domain-containing protein [Candidatus Shapirobacteria bacterium]